MNRDGVFAPCAEWRLATVRTLAWALLFGGWTVLGTLGRHHLPAWAAGQAPVALWLATVGAALALSARGSPQALPLRALLCGAGLALATLLAAAGRGGGGVALMGAAVAWGVVLVAVSMAVRRLRLEQPRRPPAPLLPALAGAAIAWACSGELARLHERLDALAVALLAAALTVSLLLGARAAARPSSGCRAGLFDCSLPMPSLAAWRERRDWPLQAAALAMLPMMAALPAMVDWCASAPGWWAADAMAWHLAAMVLPALGARAWLQRVGRRRLNTVLAGLLLAGGVSMLAWPGLNGLMLCALLHAAAWSLAWAAPMLRREVLSAPARAQRVATVGVAVMTACAVLALGLAIDRFGPPALMAVHGALALAAWVGWAGPRVWPTAIKTQEELS